MIPTKIGPLESAATVLYQDSSLTAEQRALDLVSRMTVEEKIAQTMMDAPAIPRLGVPAYHYCNEALHGVAANGAATVFPQAIALAATWDPGLVYEVASVISTEARAKYSEALELGHTGMFQGLTLWAPNVNIFRDPRWGRGQETYGEDPYLTSRMGVAFVKGIQGDHPKYLKAVATPKHFAVHSGPELLRHGFDASVSERDLYETYFPAFEACVKEGGAASIMSAYSGFNGIPCTGSFWLLTELLREDWGFDGAVVSDIDSVGDILSGHHLVEDLAEAATLAIKAGNDECSGKSYAALEEALERGLIDESDIDLALTRLFTLRFRLGMFDAPEECPYQAIGQHQNDTHAHSALALEASEKSLVLLKNDGILPLNPDLTKRVAVIGPVAANPYTLTGNYNGNPTRPTTILEGITRAFGDAGIETRYLPGCPLVYGLTEPSPVPNGCVFLVGDPETPESEKGMLALSGYGAVDYEGVTQLVRESDLTILTFGITPELEGEEMSVGYEGFEGGDRNSLELPKPQRELLEAVAAIGKPVVVVLTGGSSMAIDTEKADAILLQWYSGQQGGTAVANALLGLCSPGGRLPVTFYRSLEDLPPFRDYGMRGRTYRFYEGEPLFPFGHGLSYAYFEYDSPSPADISGNAIHFEILITNKSAIAGDEVVQVYGRLEAPDCGGPTKRLVSFQRVSLAAHETKLVTFDIPTTNLRTWDGSANRLIVAPGAYELQIGASSEDIRQRRQFTIPS